MVRTKGNFRLKHQTYLPMSVANLLVQQDHPGGSLVTVITHGPARDFYPRPEAANYLICLQVTSWPVAFL